MRNLPDPRVLPQVRVATAVAIGSVLVASSAPVIAADSTAPVVVFGMWRMLLGAGSFAILMIAERPLSNQVTAGRGTPKRDRAVLHHVGWPLLAGVLLGGENIAFVSAARSTSVATYSIIASLTPVATAILAWILLKERTTRRVILGAAVAILGAWIAARGTVGEATGGASGVVYAAVSVTLFASYLLVLVQAGRAGMKATTLLAGAFGIGTVVVALPIVLVAGPGSLGMTGRDLGLAAALAAGPGLLGHRGLAWAAPKLPAIHSSVVTMLAAPAAAAMAWFLLGQPISHHQLLGGVIAILGVTFSLTARAKMPTPDGRPACVVPTRGRAGR